MICIHGYHSRSLYFLSCKGNTLFNLREIEFKACPLITIRFYRT